MGSHSYVCLPLAARFWALGVIMARLYLMIGIPGAGKTTWARALSHVVYIGSDEIRQELYGKELTLRGHGKVHRIMMDRALKALKAGRDVVLDSSHLTRRSRRWVLKQLPPDVETVAIFLNTPLKQAFRNNRLRARHVPEIGISILRLHLAQPGMDEGFDTIRVI